MHPRTREVIDYLDLHRAELESAVHAVPAALRSKEPAAGRWSVAQIVEHLTLVEARVGQSISDQIAAAKAAGLPHETERSPVVPTLDVSSLLDRTTPITAGEASQPTAGLSAESAIARLNEQRAALRAVVHGADGLALGTVTREHPRLGVLNMYQWLVFLGAHERRHAAQIRETASALQ